MKGEGALSLREDDEDLSQPEMLLVAPWWKRSFQNRCTRGHVLPKDRKIQLTPAFPHVYFHPLWTACCAGISRALMKRVLAHARYGTDESECPNG
jgi:hypothetical protein